MIRRSCVSIDNILFIIYGLYIYNNYIYIYIYIYIIVYMIGMEMLMILTLWSDCVNYSYKIYIQLIHKPYSLNLIIMWLKIFNFYLSLSLSLLSHLFIYYNSYCCGCVHIEMLPVVLANFLLPTGKYYTWCVIIIA